MSTGDLRGGRQCRANQAEDFSIISRDVDELSASLSLRMHDLGLTLRQRADREVRQALMVATLLAAGYKRAEIEWRLGLTRSEYKRAHDQLRDALA